MARVTQVLLVVAAQLVAAAATPEASLWDRLGGLDKLKSALADTVDRHFDDPLTAPYFGPHKFDNNGARDYVKEQVLHFFSAGTGGPFGYDGKDMLSAHAKMDISETAFHALSYHLIAELERHGAGGKAEREECLGILRSLKPIVQAQGKAAPAPPSPFDPVGRLHHFVKGALPRYLQGLPLPRDVFAVRDLTLDDAYALLPTIVAVFSPLLLVQLFRKVGQSHDLDNNNSGLFQFNAGPFYKGDGIISALPFLLGLVPAALAIFGTLRGGSWTYIVPVVGYVLVPIADLVLGEDSYNATEDEEAKLKQNVYFRVVTWLYVLALTATLGAALYAIKAHDLSTYEIVGITISVGVSGGFGIGCVHELIHRPSSFELGLGVYATVLANYSHFWIEHLWGHHKRVATDQDPASSAVGDIIYTFWPRCILQSFADAVDIERRYLEKKGLSFLNNRILHGYTASAVLGYAAFRYAGAAGLWFWLGQGFVVALHIENANFIEHYGLRRRAIPGKFDRDGEPVYERPGWFHAWDTADRLTNWMLFKIQRHPDHHTNAGRPYQILRTFKESPTMPTGYAGMFVLSWFPPLFAAIMDPLVENAYRQREIMEKRGVAASAFPKGSNNMSSFFKKEGEGFYEEGSSPYAQGDDFYESDLKTASVVWDEKYDELYDGLVKQGARPLVQNRHLGTIRVSGGGQGFASSKSSHGEKKKSR
jgi:alkane 1-monooxygenase